MRPAELKKASNGRLHSNEVLGGNPEQCKQKCPRPQVVGVLNHIRGVGYTTRRAAIHFVVLKSSKISFERRRPPIGGSRFKNSTNFSDCNNKMTFFAKKVVIPVFPRVSAGRIGALRRQSAAIPGEGLHLIVRPSLAAHCGDGS